MKFEGFEGFEVCGKHFRFRVPRSAFRVVESKFLFDLNNSFRRKPDIVEDMSASKESLKSLKSLKFWGSVPRSAFCVPCCGIEVFVGFE